MIRLKLNSDLNEFLEKIAIRFALKLQKEIVLRVASRWKNRVAIEREGTTWIIGITEKIFPYWEKDTKPHDIEAKFKKALAFKWGNGPKLPNQPSKNGKYLFKKIHHPGTKGHFILDEIEQDEALLERLLAESIKEVNI